MVNFGLTLTISWWYESSVYVNIKDYDARRLNRVGPMNHATNLAIFKLLTSTESVWLNGGRSHAKLPPTIQILPTTQQFSPIENVQANDCKSKTLVNAWDHRQSTYKYTNKVRNEKHSRQFKFKFVATQPNHMIRQFDVRRNSAKFHLCMFVLFWICLFIYISTRSTGAHVAWAA